MSTIKQIVLEFEELNRCLKTSEIEIFALNEFKQILQERIFKFARTVDNTFFGVYKSASYKKKREDAGRQTKYKDLQFTGELLGDLDLGQYNGKNALGFAAERSKNIVSWQEESNKQIDKPIFSANQEEVDIVFEKIDEELDRIIAECLNT